MLIIMADLMQISVGKLFMGALLPGLGLAAMYLIFIGVWAALNPRSRRPWARTS